MKIQVRLYFTGSNKAVITKGLIVILSKRSFFVGNHEYFTGDAEAWLHELKKFGIHPLHNSHVLIRSQTNPEDKIYLAGVDDVEADRLR